MFGADIDYKIRNKSIRWIAPILTQWLRLNRNYIEEYNCEDALYWYNERANVGAFSGAVWLSGGFALEEYSSTKGKGKTESSGRIDLFISYGEFEAICEAKNNWICLSKKQTDFKSSISEAVKTAIIDVEHTLKARDGNDVYAIALNFFPTYAKKGSDTDKEMMKFYKAVKKSESSFFAWYENDSDKDILSSNGNMCNAVALVGNVVRVPD